MADPEGVHSNPPLTHNYFIFMHNFKGEKSGKINKIKPRIVDLNPLSRNPGPAPDGGGTRV